MRMPCAVAVDLEGGVITLGATRIALRSDGDHFRLPNSARVRAITFGERSAAIARALAEPDSEDSLLPGLRSLALDGSPDPQADAAVLALSGGGEQAPSFAECARQACKKTGLDWKAVEDMPAVAVDRVAAPHQTTANDDGWVRIAFEPRADDAPDLAGIAREMIERLLARGVNRSVGEAPTLSERAATTPEAPDRASLHARVRTAAAANLPRANERVSMEPTHFRQLAAPRKRPRRAWSPARSSTDPPAGASEPQPARATARLQPAHPKQASPLAPPPALEPSRRAPAPLTWPSPEAPTSLRTKAVSTTVAPIAPAAKPLAPTRASHPIETAAWSRPQAAIGPLTSWSDPASPPIQSFSPSPSPDAPPTIDWLSDIAQALVTECDLRGIDA
jgi:hypothetical protein